MTAREYHFHNGEKGAAIAVRVTTRARKNEIVEIQNNGTIKIRITASPVNGKANKALTEFLAKVLDIPKSHIEIIAGLTGRDKLISILDMSPQVVQSKILEYSLNGKALLPGYQEEARNYLPHFNLFAMSSLTEGLPITLLEAMQARVPIISTAAGGIAEVLGEGEAGLLVDFCTPSALADAIGRIIKDKDLSGTLTEAAFYRVTTSFTSEAMARKYLDIYQTIIKASAI